MFLKQVIIVFENINSFSSEKRKRYKTGSLKDDTEKVLFGKDRSMC